MREAGRVDRSMFFFHIQVWTSKISSPQHAACCDMQSDSQNVRQIAQPSSLPRSPDSSGSAASSRKSWIIRNADERRTHATQWFWKRIGFRRRHSILRPGLGCNIKSNSDSSVFCAHQDAQNVAITLWIPEVHNTSQHYIPTPTGWLTKRIDKVLFFSAS